MRKKIALLVPEQAVMEGVCDPRYLFTSANEFLTTAGRGPVFEVTLVAKQQEVHLLGGTYRVRADMTYSTTKQFDLVIIPPIMPPLSRAIELNTELVSFVQRSRAQGAEIASLCTGAFLLGETGLCSGKRISTHWAFNREFASRYPDVNLCDGAIITDSDGIYSSGGANSIWNLLIYLVEKYASREIALLCAKFFAIEVDRITQSPFALFTGLKDHSDEHVRTVQHFIEQNYRKPLDVATLAERMPMSRRTFERRFREATHHAPADYIQRVRVEAAKRLFETTRKTVAEVMYEVGYADAKSFRAVFRRITALTPLAYRNKFGRIETVSY